MSRLAPVTPPACSVCFLQRMNVRYVDFDVAWDGPVIPGAIPQPIDDLVVCEVCLADGAKHVGLGSVEDAEAARDAAEARAVMAEGRALEAEQELRELNDALDALRLTINRSERRKAATKQ